MDGSRTILAGDIGGTKSLIGLVSGPPWEPAGVAPTRYDNADYESFEALLATVMQATGQPTIDAVCIAVAGPVLGSEVRMTNLPWTLHAGRIERATRCRTIRFLNDLEATAVGMIDLPTASLCEVQAGADRARAGHVVVIAPGTGLGEAILCWDGSRHHPVASEGGHVDFAPRDERQIDLLRFLTARHGHVSYERILSGPGLVALYEFARDAGLGPEPPELRDALATGDPAAVISTKALDGSQPLCAAALDLFVRILGAKAGNLALEALALGGVFIGGGIPPRIVDALIDGRFREAFLDKGRHRWLLERMPVDVALEPDAAWVGAATFATRLLH